MIRLIGRRLIIPRGDTGSFTIPVLSKSESDSIGVFTIFNPVTKTRVFQKQVEVQGDVFNIEFNHGETVNLLAGDYLWDIKFYINPIIEDNKVIDGTEVDSYYAAFQIPKCEIRETGDDFMLIEGQPAKIEDLNIILVATEAANAAKIAATEKAEEAAARLAEMVAAIPTKVSELENDSGYLQEETDPTVPAWAKAAEKPSYTPQEVGALPADTFIPSKVSDLEDDSGHYVKPANGIPASDLEETYLTQHQDISMKANSADLAAVATSGDYSDLDNTPYIPTKTSDLTNDSNYAVDSNYVHTDTNYTTAEKEKLAGIAAGAEVNVNADWNATSGDALILNKPTNVSAFTNDAGYLTEHQDISGKANAADLAAVATSGSYNDLEDKPFIPSKASDLTDDSGHYTKPAGGIPASDLAETYLTAHQDISGKADKSEIPTSVSELTNDVGYITGYTETDPTVPAWAKAAQKPSYTAAEVNAVAKTGDTMTGTLTLPYISQSYKNALRFATNSDTFEMGINAKYDSNYNYGYFKVSSEGKSGFTQDAIIRGIKDPQFNNDAANKQYVDNKISTAIGQVNSFDMAVVQELPTQDISTHTIYLVPKTGETNDVYDEYVYINNAWEMVGNTQIDLSNYALKSELPTRVSELNNDSGYLTSYTETDPTVPQWAKASTKPSYTAVEVGALPSDTHIPSTTAELTNDAGFITGSALPTKVSDLTNDAGYLTAHQDISGKANTADLATVATSGSYEDLSNKPTIPEVPVQDVQINGTSVLNNSVANIPYSTANAAGLVKVVPDYGLEMRDGSPDTIQINPATVVGIKGGASNRRPITPLYHHVSVFYGLAKAAGADMASVTGETVGIYPDAQKAAIQNMLGITDLISTEESSTATAAHALNSTFMMNGKLHRATAAITIGDAVEVGTNCEVVKADEVFVKNTDYATSSTYGLIKISNGGGLNNLSNGLGIDAAISTTVKAGSDQYRAIVPNYQHHAVYYGLSKLAGVDLASETVTVGTYPETSKTAIRTLIGAGTPLDVQINGTSIVNSGIANIPVASSDNLGIVCVNNASGVAISSSNNRLFINKATDAETKAGSSDYKPIVASNQHLSTFYGLAKAAGDTTQSASDNAVGTYTDNAKASIKAMLGIQDGSTGTVDISGTTPTITAVENTRYVCGEVTSLNFTPSASGICIVRFTSGSTVTVLTIPNTVKFPEWFDPTSLETNTIYEICVTDGVYGAVMSWAL